MNSFSVTDYLAHTKTASHWKKIGIRPHHGICLPLFSLRTHKSCGIGEFHDLLPLIDWCKEVGFDCIQLLPLNDNGTDPSPYNSMTSQALNPLYLSLSDLPEARCEANAFSYENTLSRIDYARVHQRKLAWLFEYYKRMFKELSSDPSYSAFLQEHSWLASYALFKACKDEFQEERWQDWPAAKRNRATCKPSNPDLVPFYTFLQYLSFLQLKRVKAYAEQQGIFLKGDIPILLSPDSVDVWEYPSYFDVNNCAGAPPDYYNPKGQKWGFPLFKWDVMRADQFAWWKLRLATANQFYHLYRIDHVVGFFRIWAINRNQTATQGRFLPENEREWEPQGRELLEMLLTASPLLPLAEDLGSIPQVVYQTLKKLGICGTKVMRWERKWLSDKSYILPKDYDPISLTTVSTPDSDPLGLWWYKAPEEAKLLAQLKRWSYTPKLLPSQRLELLRDSHQSASIFHINLLQEYLALIPNLVSSNEEEERINIPGTILPTNWTYRFKPSVEELFAHKELAQKIRELRS